MSQAISMTTRASVDFRHHRRDQVEQLLERAQYLSEPDRLLIEQVYQHGISITDLARLTNNPSRSLRRRVVRLIQRMDSPMFMFVVRNQFRLPPEALRVGQLVLCQGHSLRRAAKVAGRSLHHIRRHLQTVYDLAEH